MSITDQRSMNMHSPSALGIILRREGWQLPIHHERHTRKRRVLSSNTLNISPSGETSDKSAQGSSAESSPIGLVTKHIRV